LPYDDYTHFFIGFAILSLHGVVQILGFQFAQRVARRFEVVRQLLGESLTDRIIDLTIQVRKIKYRASTDMIMKTFTYCLCMRRGS
jgi:hypothetical protein